MSSLQRSHDNRLTGDRRQSEARPQFSMPSLFDVPGLRAQREIACPRCRQRKEGMTTASDAEGVTAELLDSAINGGLYAVSVLGPEQTASRWHPRRVPRQPSLMATFASWRTTLPAWSCNWDSLILTLGITSRPIFQQ